METSVGAVDVAGQLAGHLKGRTFGTTRIENVSAEIGYDADDEQALYLSFVLSDPETETWPHEDILNLRREVLAEARRLQISFTIYVRLVPVTDLPQEDDAAGASTNR